MIQKYITNKADLYISKFIVVNIFLMLIRLEWNQLIKTIKIVGKWGWIAIIILNLRKPNQVKIAELLLYLS
jgi:hypothetical protein